MGRFVVKIGGQFCEWSTIADGPTTDLLGFAEAAQYFGFTKVECANRKGHGISHRAANFTLWAFNRAGPDECCLSELGLVRAYQPDGPGMTGHWPDPLPAAWLAGAD